MQMRCVYTTRGNRTYITEEVKKSPGFKAFTLLICGKVLGDGKPKSLLVYRDENPHMLRGKNKRVFWRSHKKAWVTATIFED